MQRSSHENTRLLSLSGKIVESEIVDDGSDSVKIKLKLKLDFKNIGSKPALILKRGPEMVERKFIATPADATEKEYLFLLQAYPSIDRSLQWEELRKRIDKSSPPSDVIRQLSPGEIWTLETTDWFYISKKTNLDPKSRPWGDILQASPVWLQVTFQMWAVNIEPRVDPNNLEFGKKLQRRWRQAGELQLENLTSEPMLLYFSSLILSSTGR